MYIWRSDSNWTEFESRRTSTSSVRCAIDFDSAAASVSLAIVTAPMTAISTRATTGAARILARSPPRAVRRVRRDKEWLSVKGRARAVLGERLADGLDDAGRLERLDDEVLVAELDGLEHLRLLAEGGAHDDAGRRVGGDDLGEGGEAVLLGHGDVQGHQVRLELVEARDRLDAVPRLADHLVAALGERITDHLAHERGVIDDEYACHCEFGSFLAFRVTSRVGGTRSGDRPRLRRL